MRIGLVSDQSTTAANHLATRDGVRVLRRLTRVLVQYGFQIQWITATDTAAALSDDPCLRPLNATAMPPTCRYVLPYELYHLDGIDLVCLNRALWQDRALHTRLFTFFCLLQRERPCALWQTCGTLATTFLTAYTASFLSLPCSVFYTSTCLREAPQQRFLWQWVARHIAAGLVGTVSERERLLAMGDLAPERVQVIDLHRPTAGARIATLYQTLQSRE
jgi:hypothetical protein